MIGQTISHYKILEKLGEGGMGEVYLAEDTKLKRKVALKFLPQEFTKNKDVIERFQREAQAAAALNHPNIVTIYEINQHEDQTYIAMEYVDGQTLKELITDHQLPITEIMDITTQICEGLSKAHEAGIVHRDIKPHNILIDKENRVKILDFGLAKLKGVSQLTKESSTMGTTHYLSPEQTMGKEVDFRTDIWSMGVILYEMTTGQLPFQGEYEAAIIYEILNVEPRSVQQFRPDIPVPLINLISQLLQKDPDKRPLSAKQVKENLTSPSFPETSTDDIKSIAVLYFENMSSDKENEYFCAGMTEDLIIDLSKIQKIKVIPRSDVLPFRNQEINTRQVGETLRVHYILEGSVRKSSNRIRISAQLIDVKKGFQIWGERYDRLIEDIFDVQTEVSEKIAEALQVSLTESEKKSLAQKPTQDLRAHDFYMRGSEFLSNKGRENIQTSIQMFEHALSIDPDFSLAYAGLVEAHSYNYLAYGGDSSVLKEMMRLNEKALKADPDLIEAQFAIGIVFVFQRLYNEAKKHFKKVIERKRDFYPAYYWLGITANILNDHDSAIKYFKAAAKIKPYSEEPIILLLETQVRKGEKKKAEETGGKVLELILRKLEFNPYDCVALSRMAITHAILAENKKALDCIKKVLEMDPQDGIVMYNCASAYGYMGNKESSKQQLKKAFYYGFNQLVDWARSDPAFESLQEDSEFQEIISK